jgi:hypothetical protein
VAYPNNDNTSRSAARLVLAICRDNGLRANGLMPPLETVLAALRAKGLSHGRALDGMLDALKYGWIDFGDRPGELVLTRSGNAASRI